METDRFKRPFKEKNVVKHFDDVIREFGDQTNPEEKKSLARKLDGSLPGSGQQNAPAAGQPAGLFLPR